MKLPNDEYSTLDVSDAQMLRLIPILQSNDLIRFRQEFCDAIDMPKQNIRNVKNGLQHFTASHIQRACKEYGVNANWVMGQEKEVFRFPQYSGRLSGNASNKSSNKMQ